MHGNVSFSCGLKVSTAFSRIFLKQHVSHVTPSEFVKSLRAFCAIFIQGTENAVEKYSFPNTAKSTIFWKGFHPIKHFFFFVTTLFFGAEQK